MRAGRAATSVIALRIPAHAYAACAHGFHAFLFSFSAFFRSTGVAFVGAFEKSATIPFRKRSPVPGPRVPDSGFLGFWDGWARRLLLPVLAFFGGGW